MHKVNYDLYGRKLGYALKWLLISGPATLLVQACVDYRHVGLMATVMAALAASIVGLMLRLAYKKDRELRAQGAAYMSAYRWSHD